MYLADVTIRQYLHDGLINITPAFRDDDIRPVGIRIHLAKKILIPHPGRLDLTLPSDTSYETVDIARNDFTLEPNAFILASTVEKVQVDPSIVCFIDGRSTLARLGLTIHSTAGVVDGNHDEARTITLEVKNLGVHSIRLRENDPVGQLMFALLTEKIQQKSQNQYSGQDGVAPPNLTFKPGVDR